MRLAWLVVVALGAGGLAPWPAGAQSILDLSTGAFSYEEEDAPEPEPDPEPEPEPDPPAGDGDTQGRVAPTGDTTAGGLISPVVCEDAAMEARAQEIGQVVRDNVPRAAGGTAALAGEWYTDRFLEMYRACYKPEYQEVIDQLEAARASYIEVQIALGVRGGTFP